MALGNTTLSPGRSLPGMARWDRGMSHRAPGRWDIQLSMGSSARLGSLHPHTEDMLSSGCGSERTKGPVITSLSFPGTTWRPHQDAPQLLILFSYTYVIKRRRSPNQPDRSNLREGRRRGLKKQACSTGGRSSHRVPKCHGWTLKMQDEIRSSTRSRLTFVHLRAPARWGR